MPLRIGFDMDGVLADFASAFHEVEVRLFGPSSHLRAGEPEREEEEPGAGVPSPDSDPGVSLIVAEVSPAKTQPAGKPHRKNRRKPAADPAREARDSRRRRDLIWSAIRSTPDFWAGLQPLDTDAVRRINELAIRHKWEVFFITQRPYTDGETVQRQTQRWLMAQGFDMPSVLVIGGSRGAAAAALRLDYHVDDSPQNCLDVLADSGAKPILLVADDDEVTVGSARKLRIGTARSIGEALDVLDQATSARTQPGLFARIATMVGWR
jgi:phosphoglycolate phosphatase-like HAD superfamily hydrolase